MPAPQTLPADLIEEGHARSAAAASQAMHEGKRRARAERAADAADAAADDDA